MKARGDRHLGDTRQRGHPIPPLGYEKAWRLDGRRLCSLDIPVLKSLREPFPIGVELRELLK